MNLCFLVEGELTEKYVYRSWIKHTFPALSEVFTTGATVARSVLRRRERCRVGHGPTVAALGGWSGRRLQATRCKAS